MKKRLNEDLLDKEVKPCKAEAITNTGKVAKSKKPAKLKYDPDADVELDIIVGPYAKETKRIKTSPAKENLKLIKKFLKKLSATKKEIKKTIKTKKTKKGGK